MNYISNLLKDGGDRLLAYINMASIALLFFIWVLPETIALRHILLATSFFASLFIIYQNFTLLKRSVTSMLPLIFLGSLFFWVGIHYIFFSLNPELEFSEIQGLWIRVLLGYVAAIGLGISFRKYPSLLKYFYVAIFFIPIINLVTYAYAVYLHGAWVEPNAFVRFLFAKIETAYFGGIAAAIAVGNLINLLLIRKNHHHYWQIFFWLLGLVLTLASALVSSTKNGMAITITLAVFLVVVILYGSLFKSRSLRAPVVGAIVFILLASGIVWQKHAIFASQGWKTIVQDVNVSLDIDTHQQWQKREGSVLAPLNSMGIPAALNTYERVAWARVGMRLIGQYPLGYGSINSSFAGLQKHANIPNENQGQTHSGWVDFGLAFGIPGLLLIFLPIISSIYLGLKYRVSEALPWVVFCMALTPFGLIAEITWKQYFEATIFFLALASTVVGLSTIRDETLH